jgi:presenilin 1
MLLAVWRKALPALPFSIFAGIVFYFATREIITPFTSALSIRQLVI